MFYVYILKSKMNNQIYSGSTINLKKRLREHNDGREVSTKRYRPWELVYYEAFVEEEMARIREKRLKHNGNAIRELKKRIGILGLPSIKSGAGFTLIEIIIVFTVLAILSVVGMASYSNYNQAQTLNNEANNLGNAIKVARSNALSQVKGNSVCSGNTLAGYQVQVYINGAPSKANTYELSAVCSSGALGPKTLYKMAPNITILSAAPTSIIFSPIITGGLTPGTIVLHGYSKDKTLTIGADGRIDIQ